MAKDGESEFFPTATHWGAYRAEVRDGHLVAMHPFAADPDPSPIGASYTDALTDRLRIPRPMIRQGWLEKGPRLDDNARGAEPFVAVPWDEALDIVARRTEAREGAARQPGDLRRLLRLGERRPLPSRAEPAAPLL